MFLCPCYWCSKKTIQVQNEVLNILVAQDGALRNRQRQEERPGGRRCTHGQKLSGERSIIISDKFGDRGTILCSREYFWAKFGHKQFCIKHQRMECIKTSHDDVLRWCTYRTQISRVWVTKKSFSLKKKSFVFLPSWLCYSQTIPHMLGSGTTFGCLSQRSFHALALHQWGSFYYFSQRA